MNKPIILIVDDEEAARYGIHRALQRENYDLFEAGNTSEARTVIKSHNPHLILLDVNLPGEDGLHFLQELSTEENHPPVIIITAHGSERTALEAGRGGAYDYLSKPFEVDELRVRVRNAIEAAALRHENRKLKQQLAARSKMGEMLGETAAMRRVYDQIGKVADTDITVLILGESGTGKELVAREIHRRSTHRKGEFVAMNCAAVPSELIESELFGHEKGAFTGAAGRRKGKFEQADGGTLFLDEIGDMNPNTQAKVLRALEERVVERLGGNDRVPVDVRFISATHKDLATEIESGRFRQDLYFRLNVVTIKLPPLRERRDDIPRLAQHFLEQYADSYNLRCRALTNDAMAALMTYQWPGNVRELKNVIERSLVLSDGETLEVSDLPPELKGSSKQQTSTSAAATTNGIAVDFSYDFKEVKRDFERQYIERCLSENGGNVTRTAELLSMHRQSLQHKLRELGITKRYIAEGMDGSE